LTPRHHTPALDRGSLDYLGRSRSRLAARAGDRFGSGDRVADGHEIPETPPV